MLLKTAALIGLFSQKNPLYFVTAWMASARYPTFPEDTPAMEIRPSLVMQIENSFVKRSTCRKKSTSFISHTAELQRRITDMKEIVEYLFGFEAREAEHPDLVNDVLPVVGGAVLLQTCHQLFSHLNDAVSHAVDLLQPTVKNKQKTSLKLSTKQVCKLYNQYSHLCPLVHKKIKKCLE